MASSNRHWPSMFKSKPCNPHHQWQHDINSSFKAPYASVTGCEERSPEPKPRWNPKPEQIRILEAIFNSGMVNPPRDEIRKIRTQLQEYGQVGDANVFYWFQNRKSRSKHKQRHLQTTKSASQTTPTPTSATVMTSSSSSSSEKSSPRGSVENALSVGSAGVIDMSNSPTGSVNQTYFQPHGEYSAEPFFFQVQTGGGPGITQGFCFPELSNLVQIPEQGLVHGTGMLSELISLGDSKREEEMEKMKMEQHLSFTAAATTSTTSATTNAVSTTTTTTAINDVQGALTQSGGAARSTVFINGVAFDVAMGPLNLREVFGDDAVLLHSTGQPVLTNEWGVTLHSLQHGASYYLV